MADPKPPQNDKGKKARSFGPYALFLFVLVAIMILYGGRDVWQGKVELSLRGHGHEEIDSDAERVLSVLTRGVLPEISDRAIPEQIRQQFGLSKKAFKRAVGRLLKEGTVQLDREGFIRRSV